MNLWMYLVGKMRVYGNRKKDEYQDGNIADRQSIGTQRKNKRM